MITTSEGTDAKSTYLNHSSGGEPTVGGHLIIPFSTTPPSCATTPLVGDIILPLSSPVSMSTTKCSSNISILGVRIEENFIRSEEHELRQVGSYSCTPFCCTQFWFSV
ncbi:hypothetical protein CDAR_213121 [Caerostris darwini]|uniref:Uncharacterized protein n=1 Tax=Caerostris darwini TaxID=1538125 RepID=A0AAV4PZP4_9ARAC|nr:hypothetical protein CDAR_213121 [Caerostris darwini]